MKAIRALVLSLFAALTLTAGAVGCDGPLDRAIDCQKICTRYKDCANSSYDVNACADRCRSKAGSSDAFDQQADVCRNCLDDRSCVDSAFQCTAECAPIVP